jgi:hypothetical protein
LCFPRVHSFQIARTILTCPYGGYGSSQSSQSMMLRSVRPRETSDHITKEYLLEVLHEQLNLSEEQFRHCGYCDDCTELVTTFLLELICEKDRTARAR